MAVSGSFDYNLTASEIITAALRTIGILRAGQGASTDQITTGMEALNILIKSLQNRGLNLFALQKTYLLLQNNVNEYTLGPAGSHWTTSFVSTQLSAAAVATDTTVTVDDASSISANDYIGIELDSGSWHWTTVNGAPVGNVVTLTDAMPSAAAVDQYVYSYTTKAQRPMDIDRIVVRNVSGNDIPVSIITLEEYSRLPNKTTDGRTLQAYYDPQLSAGKLSVWPATDTITDYFVCWVQRTLDDIDASSDDLAFPQEWYKALRYGLAADLAPEYQVHPSIWDRVQLLSDKYLEDAEAWDSETVLYIQPASQNNQD